MCILRGFRWGEGLSASSCSEHEYYEDLLRVFTKRLRVRLPLLCVSLQPEPGMRVQKHRGGAHSGT